MPELHPIPDSPRHGARESESQGSEADHFLTAYMDLLFLPVFIGVLFRLVWLKIDGTGLDGVYSIYQGHLFFQEATYASVACVCLCLCLRLSLWLLGMATPKQEVSAGRGVSPFVQLQAFLASRHPVGFQYQMDRCTTERQKA